MVWIELAQVREGVGAGSCQCGEETYGFTKDGEFIV
jgi:hypothetical protein